VAVPNHTRHALARIPLRWMIRECFEAQTGLIFDMDRLHYEVGLGIDFDARECVPRSSSLSHQLTGWRQTATRATASVAAPRPGQNPQAGARAPPGPVHRAPRLQGRGPRGALRRAQPDLRPPRALAGLVGSGDGAAHPDAPARVLRDQRDERRLCLDDQPRPRPQGAQSRSL
jgi:hypothetical protein